MAGERQSTRIRSLYLQSVLRQDIAFFDVEMTTGEAASRMSADTVLVQDALGEKVTSALDYVEKTQNQIFSVNASFGRCTCITKMNFYQAIYFQ